MKEIKIEFENYLKALVETYPKADKTILQDPSSLSGVGANSRDFNAKAQAKIKEIATNNPSFPLINLKVELSSITVQYHSKLMMGHI